LSNKHLKLISSCLAAVILITLPIVLSACSTKPEALATTTAPGSATGTTGTTGTPTPAQISYILINPSVSTSLVAGQTLQFSATAAWNTGYTEDISSQGTWVSTDESIVTVSSTGLATSIKPGKASVNIVMDGVPSGTVEISVKMVGYDLASIAVSRSVISNLAVGATQQLKATGTTKDGIAKDVTTMANWTSSDERIATVSETGLVTAIAPGKTTITADMSDVTSIGIVMTVDTP
jgi:hypothetical protein